MDSTTTGAGGFYLFENIPVGDCQVQMVELDGYVANAATKDVKVLDQTAGTIDFRVAEKNYL